MYNDFLTPLITHYRLVTYAFGPDENWVGEINGYFSETTKFTYHSSHDYKFKAVFDYFDSTSLCGRLVINTSQWTFHSFNFSINSMDLSIN